MNRRLFKAALLLLFFVAGSLYSLTQAQQRLVVWMKDGQKVYYDLAENPKTTFQGTDIVITTTTLTINYPIEQVLRYTYELPPSGIENANLSKPVVISFRNNVLSLENLEKGTNIQIYSIDGKLLSAQTADGHQTIISLVSYPVGIYIVKANEVTYKLMKK